MKPFTVGIIAPDNATGESLKAGIMATGMASVVIQSGEYYASKSDWPLRRFAEANPEIVIIEIRDQAPALRCLKVLGSVLPKAHFLVASHLTDPQLIIEAMHSGAREFVPLPVTQSTLVQALTRYKAESEQLGADHTKRGKLYSFISAKPGSGATTLALNVAGITAADGKSRVGFLDLNQPVGDAAAYLNLKPMFTIAETMAAVHRLDPVLLESFTTPTNGFHLLAGFREHTPPAQFNVEAMSQILDVSMHTFAHTFADVSEHIDEAQAQAVSSMSTAILLVVTPDVPSIWRTERLLNFLSKTNDSSKIRVVLNRKARTDEISEADIEKLLHHSINFTVPNDYAASMKALNSGRLLDPKEGKNLARAYQELAAQLAGHAPAERRGLWDMFLKPSSPGRASNG